MRFHTDSPLTLSILGALNELHAATVGEVAAAIGDDTPKGRDKVGTTLRRMSDAGLTDVGGSTVTNFKRAADLWCLTPAGRDKRQQLLDALGFAPNGSQTTRRRETESHRPHKPETGGSTPPGATETENARRMERRAFASGHAGLTSQL